MRTHPWLEARAEYLAARTPVADQPSVLGDTELAEAVQDAPSCEFPHGDIDRVPTCSVEVVALLGATCKESPPDVLICQAACDFIKDGMTMGLCRNCLRKCSVCWWIRLI